MSKNHPNGSESTKRHFCCEMQPWSKLVPTTPRPIGVRSHCQLAKLAVILNIMNTGSCLSFDDFHSNRMLIIRQITPSLMIACNKLQTSPETMMSADSDHLLVDPIWVKITEKTNSSLTEYLRQFWCSNENDPAAYCFFSCSRQ